MLLRALALLVLAAGCATQSPVVLDTGPRYALTASTVEGRDYVVSVADNPTARRFDFTLQSNVEQPVCLDIEIWPHRGYFADVDAFVEVGDRRFPITPFNFNYCPGGCGTHFVEPRGTLTGFVAYEQFSAEAFVSDGPRRLVTSHRFPVYQCSRESNQ